MDRPDGRLRPRRVRLLFLVAAVVFVADLISKTIVVATLSHRPPVRLLGGLLRLTELRNPGAAFSIGASSAVMTVAFSLIAVGVIVAILRTSRRLRSVPWAITLGLLLGGAVGNLGDRIFRSPGPFRGYVVDWIQLPHWPVFNVADCASCAAACWPCCWPRAASRWRERRSVARRARPTATRHRGQREAARRGARPFRTAPGGRRRPVTQSSQRRVPVPEGLDGERLDAALARMFGLSRASAAELISSGQVLLGGRAAAKSERVPAGEWLDVTLPGAAPAAPVPRAPARPGRGL